MKYLPIRELETVTCALNFNTSDIRVVGGCDLYITKAAGKDRKLYKSIDKSLNSQHESLVRLSESLSPPNAEMFNMNLSRSSPFGPLSQNASRRTFAYLIATLNASHPDYDFSHLLRPSDFQKERNMKAVINNVDETLYNLRPRPASSHLAASNWGTTNGTSTPQTPGGGVAWSPRMWKIIDSEMTLNDCEIYRYSPEDDPFDGEESAIWSTNFFFFNKIRRRVLYIHFRGLRLSNHSAPQTPAAGSLKRARPVSQSLSISGSGASKRARFWLGDKADRCVSEPLWGEDDDGDSSDYVTIPDPGDDDVYADDERRAWSSADELDDEFGKSWLEKNSVRGVSESIMESLEV